MNLIVENIEENLRSALPSPTPPEENIKLEKPCNLRDKSIDGCKRKMKNDCGNVEGLVISISTQKKKSRIEMNYFKCISVTLKFNRLV